jgi:hypothetical protein
LRSIETGAGIAGKDFGEIRGLWPETAIAFSTAELVQLAAGPKQAHPRKKTRWLLWLEDTSKWTCLAVQQQLIEPDSHADYISRCQRHRCINLRFNYIDQ